MRPRDKVGGKAAETQRLRTLKRRSAPKVGRKPPTADEKIALLEHRLNEALEQQTATSEILKVISNSPGHLEPVFNAMLEKAVRICEAKFGVLWLCENGGIRSVAQHNTPPAFAEHRGRSSCTSIPSQARAFVDSPKRARSPTSPT